MSEETARAFQRFVDAKAWGPKLDGNALYKTWQRACRRVERELQEEYGDPSFRLPKIRLKDIRHSFGTHTFERTQNEAVVGMMLDHAPGSPMTRRYTLGAVPSVLRKHVRAFPGRKRVSAPAKRRRVAS